MSSPRMPMLIEATLLATACSAGARATGDAGEADVAPASHDGAHTRDANAGDAKRLFDARAADRAASEAEARDARVSADVFDAPFDVSFVCQPIDAGNVFGPPACASCVSAACCSQVERCLAPADGGKSPCFLLAACVSACERDAGAEPSCELSCSEAYPAGIDLAETVNDCLTSNCTGDAGADACGSP